LSATSDIFLRFSGQGVEKINDDIEKYHLSKTNKWETTVDALQVRKRIKPIVFPIRL
jgi:hypothetical protein